MNLISVAALGALAARGCKLHVAASYPKDRNESTLEIDLLQYIENYIANILNITNVIKLLQILDIVMMTNRVYNCT